MATPGAAALPSENESVDSDTEDPLALELRGCSVMPDLNGVYRLIDALPEVLAHKRPIYKKLVSDSADREIYCYFCEDDSGKPGRTGWWLAFEVGGENTCAYNASRGFRPPIKGWQVFDGEGERSDDGVALVAGKPPGIVPHTSASASSSAVVVFFTGVA